MRSRGITPAPPADRRTWIRRATFDLTGLPPSPDEVAAFLADGSATAFEKLVDRLLASPAYGQRWARHWLDVARYADYYDADPKTRTASCELTEAWRYRDWVVDAFNRDLPFDQFIVHQIAGDLLPDPDGGEVYPAGLIATTFLSNGVWDRGDADKEKIVSDMVDDQIDTVGKAFLGLTLGCARCHDHKFDPVSQQDYYALAGIFYSTHILKDLGAKGAEYVMNRVPLVPRAQVEAREKQLRLIAEIEAKLAAIEKRPQVRERRRSDGPSSSRSATGSGASLPRRAAPGDGRAGRGNSGRTVSQDPGRADPHPRQLRQAGTDRRAAVAAILRGRHPTAHPRRERPAGTGPLGGVGDKPAHRAGDRQPRLAVAFRRGPRAHAEQFRHALGAPVPPEAPRLAGGAVRRRRLVAQEASPAHHAFGRLPAVERRGPRPDFPQTPRTAGSDGSPRGGWTRKRSATRCSA